MKKIKVQELQITVGKTFKNCDSTVDTPCLVVFVANLIWLKLKWLYTSLGEFLVSFSQFNEVILTSSVDRFLCDRNDTVSKKSNCPNGN